MNVEQFIKKSIVVPVECFPLYDEVMVRVGWLEESRAWLEPSQYTSSQDYYSALVASQEALSKELQELNNKVSTLADREWNNTKHNTVWTSTNPTDFFSYTFALTIENANAQAAEKRLKPLQINLLKKYFDGFLVGYKLKEKK